MMNELVHWTGHSHQYFVLPSDLASMVSQGAGALVNVSVYACILCIIGATRSQFGKQWVRNSRNGIRRK